MLHVMVMEIKQTLEEKFNQVKNELIQGITVNPSGIEGVKDCNSKSEQDNLTYGRHGHPSLVLKKKY